MSKLKEIREKLHTEAAVERAKLKDMSFREKIVYIKEYYFWQILFGSIALAVAIWALNFYVLNPPPQLGLGVAFYGSPVTIELLERVEGSLNEAIMQDASRYNVVASNFFQLSGDPEFTLAMIQQFAALITARQIDVMIVHPDTASEILAQGFAMDLRLVFSEAELAAKSHIVVYGSIADFDAATGQALSWGEYYPAGLSLRHSPYFYGIADGFADWMLLIVANSPREVAARDMILWTVGY